MKESKRLIRYLLALLILTTLFGVAYDIDQKRQWNKLEKERLTLSISLLKMELKTTNKPSVINLVDIIRKARKENDSLTIVILEGLDEIIGK